MNRKSTYKFKQSKQLPANRRRKPQPDVFKLIAVLVISLALLFVLISIIRYKDAHAEPKPVEIRLSEYIEDFFDGSMPKREATAKTYIPYIIDAAEASGVDPFLIAEVIKKESSFRWLAIGKKGEYGLGQMMVKYELSCDFFSPKGQIQCIAKRLKRTISSCGHILPAINQYLTGECNPIIGKARYRYLQYLKTSERYGE